ncbi:MAG: hypothetical protein ACK5TY_04050 [Verrucomicrobiota bacterium]
MPPSPLSPLTPPPPEHLPPRRSHASTGCLTGGCLLPFLLFLFAASQGDLGGPLFWPLLSAILGFLGLLIGLSISRKQP